MGRFRQTAEEGVCREPKLQQLHQDSAGDGELRVKDEVHVGRRECPVDKHGGGCEEVGGEGKEINHERSKVSWSQCEMQNLWPPAPPSGSDLFCRQSSLP